MKEILTAIVATPELHARWLNTLSYLENCGARKIAACEHPRLVKEEMLKHAAEEFRHAYYLKRQIERVSPSPLETYAHPFLLGGPSSRNYIQALDLQTCRYLKQRGLSRIKEAAYLLVTYAIELRASALYHSYATVLKMAGSKVTVKSILLEEKEHLQAMEAGLQKLALPKEPICRLEENLFKDWVVSIQADVKHFTLNPHFH